MEPIEPTTTPTPSDPANSEAGKPEGVSLAKASGSLRQILEWLVSQPMESKIAAVSLSVLTDGDVSNGFQRQGSYQGNLADDLLDSWWAELGRIVSGEEEADPQTRAVAAFISGIDCQR